MVTEHYSKRLLEINMQIEEVRNQFCKEIKASSDLESKAKKKIISEMNHVITGLLILLDSYWSVKMKVV